MDKKKLALGIGIVAIAGGYFIYSQGGIGKALEALGAGGGGLGEETAIAGKEQEWAAKDFTPETPTVYDFKMPDVTFPQTDISWVRDIIENILPTPDQPSPIVTPTPTPAPAPLPAKKTIIKEIQTPYGTQQLIQHPTGEREYIPPSGLTMTGGARLPEWLRPEVRGGRLITTQEKMRQGRYIERLKQEGYAVTHQMSKQQAAQTAYQQQLQRNIAYQQQAKKKVTTSKRRKSTWTKSSGRAGFGGSRVG